ncbi:hypothetical protein SK128_027739 [Halocaridina rubra]|uniref:Uncharacterized protein n=1 Tax=Halocaridina rubra TaxID=373956 RepID=A0AAN8X321_HALRR
MCSPKTAEKRGKNQVCKMERDLLLENYEEAIQKQAALLKKQQLTTENLQDELSNMHQKVITSNKQNQSKVEALCQQIQQGVTEDFSEETSLLQQELETALKEKELSQAECKRHALEVQRLRQELGSIQVISNDGTRISVAQMKEYEDVIRALEEETIRLRSEVSKMEDEKVDIMKINLGLKKQISSLELQLEQESHEICGLRTRSQERERVAQEMKEAFTNLNKQYLDQSEDLRTLLAQTKLLQKNKDHLSKVVMTVNEKLKEAKTRVSESVRIAEDALVEKDAALLREKHALNEVARLESTVSSLTVEAGEKTSAEISKVKNDYNTNIKTMSEEILKLEMALNESNLECSKAKREHSKAADDVRVIQSELQHKKAEHQEEVMNLLQRISSLENKIVVLSGERDILAEHNTHTVQEYEKQREELLARIQELEHLLMVSQTNFESLRIEHDEVKRRYSSLSEELVKVKEENQSNEKILRRQLRTKIEELEEVSSSSRVRLDATDSCHRDVIKQLNENISVLQESYLRVQSHLANQKMEYEERTNDLLQRLEDYSLKYKNVLQSLHETKTELDLTKDLSSQYELRIKEVEARLQSAEQRFATIKTRSSVNTDNVDIW